MWTRLGGWGGGLEPSRAGRVTLAAHPPCCSFAVKALHQASQSREALSLKEWVLQVPLTLPVVTLKGMGSPASVLAGILLLRKLN